MTILEFVLFSAETDDGNVLIMFWPPVLIQVIYYLVCEHSTLVHLC